MRTGELQVDILVGLQYIEEDVGEARMPLGLIDKASAISRGQNRLGYRKGLKESPCKAEPPAAMVNARRRTEMGGTTSNVVLGWAGAHFAWASRWEGGKTIPA